MPKIFTYCVGYTSRVYELLTVFTDVSQSKYSIPTTNVEHCNLSKSIVELGRYQITKHIIIVRLY